VSRGEHDELALVVQVAPAVADVKLCPLLINKLECSGVLILELVVCAGGVFFGGVCGHEL
jgi:hypothetical protein